MEKKCYCKYKETDHIHVGILYLKKQIIDTSEMNVNQYWNINKFSLLFSIKNMEYNCQLNNSPHETI